MHAEVVLVVDSRRYFEFHTFYYDAGRISGRLMFPYDVHPHAEYAAHKGFASNLHSSLKTADGNIIHLTTRTPGVSVVFAVKDPPNGAIGLHLDKRERVRASRCVIVEFWKDNQPIGLLHIAHAKSKLVHECLPF